jgi:hypothetical protein
MNAIEPRACYTCFEKSFFFSSKLFDIIIAGTKIKFAIIPEFKLLTLMTLMAKKFK